MATAPPGENVDKEQFSDAATKDDPTSNDQTEVCLEKVEGNPYIENKKTGGATLVIPQREPWAPWPFKKIKTVIIVSYVCYLFLFFPGAFANKYAWEAKKYKELGAVSEAKEMARSAVCWIYVGFVIGGMMIIAGIIVAIVT